MDFPLLSSGRTVMLVTDEAAFIYAVSSRGSRLVESVPWDAENFEKNVAGILKKDCAGKPVIVLNDMVEQHYRKEKILKAGVGVMDRSGMLKRKLNMAFPNYPVKASFPLKEKPPKTDKKGASTLHIFAALPDSNQLSASVSSVNRSLVSLTGFGLLPIESSDMVKTLSAKLTKKAEPKCRWVLFIGQHKSGGLRQIVTKNGELALTRMTPVVDNDNDVDAWASQVHQEFKATMSYLTRFGFQQEDGLHVIVMANSAAGEAIEAKIEESCKYTALTSAEAARLLGFSVGAQDDFRYADPLHVGWVAKKRSLILPMRASRIDEVSRPRQTALAATVILGLGLGFLGVQIVGAVSSLAGINSEIDQMNSSLAGINVQYEKEVKRKEALGFDIRLVQSSIAVRTALEKDNIKVLSALNGVGRALGRDLRLDRITLSRPQGGVVGAVMGIAQGQTSPPLYEAVLQMTYPSTTNVDKGNQEVSELKDRLMKTLPGHTVEVTKFLKDYEYVEEVVVETGDLERKDVNQDFVAEILIKGPSVGAQEASQ